MLQASGALILGTSLTQPQPGYCRFPFLEELRQIQESRSCSCGGVRQLPVNAPRIDNICVRDDFACGPSTLSKCTRGGCSAVSPRGLQGLGMIRTEQVQVQVHEGPELTDAMHTMARPFLTFQAKIGFVTNRKPQSPLAWGEPALLGRLSPACASWTRRNPAQCSGRLLARSLPGQIAKGCSHGPGVSPSRLAVGS